MVRRLNGTLVAVVVVGSVACSPASAQSLAAKELEALETWYRRTADRTGTGEWGVAVGTMDGRVLWSVSPELALIPASTAKVFTTGFTRSRVGGQSGRPSPQRLASITALARANASSTLDAWTRIIGGSLAPLPA